jgi:uncharacterized membrane protein
LQGAGQVLTGDDGGVMMLIYLVAGLLMFLGVHSTRLLADGWRSRTIGRLGEGPWKGLYSLISLVGFVLLVWGYGVARQQPVQLWSPPVGLRHLAAPLTWLAFVLVTAAYVPGNQLKARLHHPMLLGTKAWALAHLLANGTLAGLLLFGSFLVWAIVMFASSRRRDRRAGLVSLPGRASRTAITVAVGTLAWAGFAFWLHGSLIGIRPIG